jgi:ABC-type iron transport system FetAB ATPase subunit
MAATRLIALHVNKSKGASASMHERIEYSQNPEKTEDGELITAYACQPATAAEEFRLQVGICQGYMGSRKTFEHTVFENLFYPMKMRSSKSGVCGLL